MGNDFFDIRTNRCKQHKGKREVCGECFENSVKKYFEKPTPFHLSKNGWWKRNCLICKS